MTDNKKFGLFNTIQEQYEFIKSNPKDQLGKDSIHWIAPYMEVLNYYANYSEIVVEFGVNQVNSTWAFLNSNCKEVHSVDLDFHKNPIKRHPELKENIWLNHAIKLAKRENKKFFIYETSSLDVRFSKIDFLFIDSLHKGSHLEQELKIHSQVVNKYLGFHDTKLFAHELMPVINDFLRNNPNWKIEFFDNRECGLTILQKY